MPTEPVTRAAARAGDVERLRSLCSDADQDFTSADGAGWTPLHLAAYLSHVECLKVIPWGNPWSQQAAAGLLPGCVEAGFSNLQAGCGFAWAYCLQSRSLNRRAVERRLSFHRRPFPIPVRHCQLGGRGGLLLRSAPTARWCPSPPLPLGLLCRS